MDRASPAVESDLRRAWSSLRFSQWRHFLALPLASVLPDLREHPIQTTPRFVLALVCVAASLAFAYGVNSITDRGGDRSTIKNPLVGSTSLPSAVPAMVAASALLAILAGAAISAASAGWTSVSLLASTLYSAGPRLKALPFVNTVTNALIFVPLLGVGMGPNQPLPPGVPMLMLAFGALLTQSQLVHEVCDEEEDIASGTITSAVWLGPTSTFHAAAATAIVSALVLGAFCRPLVASRIASFLVALPTPWVVRSTRAKAERLRRAYRAYSIVAGAIVFAAVLWEQKSV